MSQLKHDVSNKNLHITEWMNDISISGDNYYKIVSNKFNLYSSYSCPLFRDYMDNLRFEWDEYKEFTAKKVREMDPKKYNNSL